MRQIFILPKGDHRDRARDRLVASLQDLDPNQDWTVAIDRSRQPRSDEQHAYYRGVVLRTFCRETGNDEESVHAEWKARFLPKRYFTALDGRLVERDGSTKDVTMEVMSDFIDHCIVFSAEWGVVVPPPRYSRIPKATHQGLNPEHQKPRAETGSVDPDR